MKNFGFLNESRVEEFQSKYGNKFSKDQIKRIVDMIQPKYLNWVGKVFDPLNFEQNFETLYKNLQKFEKISSNLPLTDISSYKSLQDLSKSLTEYENKSKRQYRKVEGGNVVYEDERFFVVNPLTYDASCYYGKGTKWCTAANTDENFHRYNGDGKLFYVLDKALSSSDPFYKVAILKKFEGDTIYWDAKDVPLKSYSSIIGPEKLEEINSNIESYMEEFFSEQIKIFRDKEAARREKERLEKLRIQRELNRKSNDAEQRRLENEWDLSDPNISDEGLKAHALLSYLESSNEVEVITQEDKNRITEIENQINELNAQYESSEGVDTEILNQISDLEDELEEYSSKIDVYNIIPVGEFYDMTRFEVLEQSLYNHEYAVGTQSEVDQSAEEYVEQLIDDIGYDGFSKSFAESHIDEEEVARYAYDSYYNDVSENPESYLDDEDKNLSDRQQDRITYLRKQIEEYQDMVSRFEDLSDESEDEDLIEQYQEKIEVFQEKIEENESEIEEIESEPDGEYDQDAIDRKVDDLVEDVRRDPSWYIRDLGLDINEFIDRDEFVKAVIDSDGVGIINGYDGSYDEHKVNDTWYYVMRIN